MEQQILGQLEICSFKIPPCQDIIAIGKQAPVGKHGVQIMLDAIAPDLFLTIELKHPTIEVLIIRKTLIKLFGKEHLVKLVVKEIECLMDETAVLNIGLNGRLIKSVTFNIKSDGNYQTG